MNFIHSGLGKNGRIDAVLGVTRIRRMKLLLVLLFLLVGCKTPDVDGLNPLERYMTPQSKDDALTMRDEYLEMINDLRNKEGVDPLIYSEVIEEVAQAHADKMAKGLVAFGHTGSTARCQQIITEMGPANLCGEIVAKGQASAKEVFAAWTSSTTHKSKILNRRYTHTGLGISKSSEGVSFWVEIFLEVL